MLEPDDESLSDWYTTRSNRYRPAGTRDALIIDPEARSGLLFQDALRLVVEWDGAEWQPIGVAENYSEAYSLIVRRGSGFAPPQEDTPVALLRKGSGRHRKS
ncbi:DUF6087 family protein [Kitasatospora sp. NPDC086791]|uniref:DUF6087 family protein n=1 Tax=Kitasatospora sp. NPDC086791 TaxID=3155178 RepID=UPI003445AB67